MASNKLQDKSGPDIEQEINSYKSDFEKRISELLYEELKEPEIYYWFSFAEPKKFKGGVIIKCHGITDGLMKINLLGINPGGEMLCIPIELQEMVTEDLINRLLSKEDIIKYCGGTISPDNLKG